MKTSVIEELKSKEDKAIKKVKSLSAERWFWYTVGAIGFAIAQTCGEKYGYARHERRVAYEEVLTYELIEGNGDDEVEDTNEI